MRNHRAALALSLTTLGIALLWVVRPVPSDKVPSPEPTVIAKSATNIKPPFQETAMVPWQGAGQTVLKNRAKPEEITAFDQWAKTTVTSDNVLTDEELSEGIRLAEARRPVLKQLIQDDPEAALAFAVPWVLRNRLPEEVTEQLEERVSAPAQFSVLAVVPQPGEELSGPALFRTAVIDGEVMQANVYGAKEAVDSKNDLPIDGIVIDDQLAILDATLRPVEAGEPVSAAPQPLFSPKHLAGDSSASSDIWIYGGQPYELCCNTHVESLATEFVIRESSPGPELAASGGTGSNSGSGFELSESSWTEGTKSLLVIRVDFSDLTGAPVDGSSNVIDAAYLTQRVNDEVADWIEEVSYNKGSMTLNAADVTGVLRMPQTAATYASGNLNTDLRIDSLALAAAAGFTTENYDRVAVVFSDLDGFPGSQITYGGLGQVGGSFSWYNGNFSFGVATHEFGHNYGLRHANRWQIPGGSMDPVDPGGSSTEYGDVFDMMGSSPSDPATNADHFNPWFLNRLDWLADSSIETITTSGTYRVYRFDHQSANAANSLALKIDRSATENYWVGYRRKYAGHPSRGDVSLGAYLMWGYDFQSTSNLIDVDTPGVSPNDASLNVGNTFDDTAAGIQFTVTAAGGSGNDEYLDIAVTFDPRISFSQTSYDVDEASGNLAVVLTRTNNATGAVSVTLSTADDSATSPADYTATSILVSWADGDDSPKTINIPVVSDAITEGSESFNLQLTGISGGVILNESTVVANIREPGASDSSFTHGFFNSSGSVRKMALQPDGRIAFVGRASNISGEAVNGIGRFESNGSLDSAYSTASSANITPVYAIARQPDGKILVAGAFTTISGVTRNRVARLYEDGTLDTSFDVGTGPNNTVNAIALRPDGRIVVVGDFTSVAGTARRGIAQLLPDGSLDTTFLSTPYSDFLNIEPECVALQPDGKVIVGGSIYTSFDALFEDFSSGILRLETDGSIDTTFDIGSGAHGAGSISQVRRVYAVAVQPDGKIVIGGSFTAFDEVATSRLARLNANGSLDTAFTTAIGTGADDLVVSIFVQGDGDILVGGDFSTLNGNSRPRVARLSAAGVFDSAFDAAIPPTFGGGSTNDCYEVLMQPDTRILITLDEFGGGQTGVKRVFSAQAAPSGQVEFLTGSSVVNEGSTASVSVRRVGGSLGPISISYATIADTATTADFVAETGVLTWADGEAADKVITVDTTADSTTEPNEFFTIQLGTPIGGTSLATTGIASVTINDLLPLQSWRLNNFGNSANSGTGADDFDADSDLVVNLMEYALDRSPTVSAGADGVDSLPTYTTAATDPLLIGRLVLVSDLPDPAPADITYVVEVTETLASAGWDTLATKTGTGAWTWEAGGTSRIVETSSAGRSTVQVGDSVTLQRSSTRRFMRLRVTN